jgi:hypothetical protein
MRICLSAFFVCFILPLAAWGAGDSNCVVFNGTSDASAAAAIGDDKFIVGDDENNTLRIYAIGVPKPVFSFDLTAFLGTTAKSPEADIEAAAKVSNRVYWITSHGRNKDGLFRPNRCCFFAADIVSDSNGINIRPLGRPYQNLLFDIVENKSDVQRDLIKAAGFASKLEDKDLEKLAPKKEGLNIEGLCASADGNALFIGFRNPLHKQRGKKFAIVIPLKNAASVIENGQKPVLGQPLLWDLHGLGIRDMAWSPFHKKYFIIAGPSDERRNFAIFQWSGDENEQPVVIWKYSLPENFTPEALITFEGGWRIFILSDDGSLEIDVKSSSECMEGRLIDGKRCPNKFLADPNKKTFRGLWLSLPVP